jgi:hypothetical protein
VQGFERFPKHQTKSREPKKVIKLNVDSCPDLKGILEEIEMGDFLMKFARMGITETRLLLRMSEMDYTMMTLDWPDITEEQVGKVRAVVKKYHDIAAAAAEEVEIVMEMIDPERAKLKFGRVLLPGAVQYFEYMQASFGGPPPLGTLDVEMAPIPHSGCSPAFYRNAHRELEARESEDAVNVDGDTAAAAEEEEKGEKEEDDEDDGMDLTGKVYVVKRGHCSFLQKAQYAYKHNASALLIVNDVDRLETAASGYGINPRVTSKDVKLVQSLPVFSVSSTAWAKLAFSAQHGYQWTSGSASTSSATTNTAVHAGSSGEQQLAAKDADLDSLKLRFVPLKCGEKHSNMQTSCQPLLEREKKLNPEVTWGSMRISSSGSGGEGKVTKSFQFLTSSFGGVLPVDTLTLIPSDPSHGCKPLANADDVASTRANVAVAMERGGCMFQDKLKHAEQAGARMAIVMEGSADSALQRIGGNAESSGDIGMPSVMCSWMCNQYITQVLEQAAAAASGGGSGSVTIKLSPASGQSLAQKWIDLVIYEWSHDEEEKARQMEQMLPHYTSEEDLEIAAWLRRTAASLRAGPVDVHTDGY